MVFMSFTIRVIWCQGHISVKGFRIDVWVGHEMDEDWKWYTFFAYFVYIGDNRLLEKLAYSQERA